MESTLIEGLVERITQASSVHSSVGVILPCNNYNDFTHSVFELIRNKQANRWVYVTITKPYQSINREYADIINNSQIRFIDCVSVSSGIAFEDDHCFFLDSPSQLERLMLEILSFVKQGETNEVSFVVIDSLSSLSLYNDELLVTEFLSHLINSLQPLNTHSISMCIEEEMNDVMMKMMYLKNEKILKIKESFI